MSSVSAPPTTSIPFSVTPVFRCPLVTDTEYVSLHDNECCIIIGCINKNVLIVFIIVF